jgi:hypothetical protein
MNIDERYRKIDPGLPERLEGNRETLKQVYDSSFLQLKRLDLAGVSVNCGAVLDRQGRLTLKYFQREVEADIEKSRLYYADSGEETDLFTASIILHYMITADGEPISGRWISYRELPDGMFYFRTIPGVLEPLRNKFGPSFASFAEKASVYGGGRSSSFKNGIITNPFPYLPLMLILEEGSEEFDPEIRVLFDSSASHYIKTDIAKVLLVNIVKLLAG